MYQPGKSSEPSTPARGPPRRRGHLCLSCVSCCRCPIRVCPVFRVIVVPGSRFSHRLGYVCVCPFLSCCLCPRPAVVPPSWSSVFVLSSVLSLFQTRGPPTVMVICVRPAFRVVFAPGPRSSNLLGHVCISLRLSCVCRPRRRSDIAFVSLTVTAVIICNFQTAPHFHRLLWHLYLRLRFVSIVFVIPCGRLPLPGLASSAASFLITRLTRTPLREGCSLAVPTWIGCAAPVQVSLHRATVPHISHQNVHLPLPFKFCHELSPQARGADRRVVKRWTQQKSLPNSHVSTHPATHTTAHAEGCLPPAIGKGAALVTNHLTHAEGYLPQP